MIVIERFINKNVCPIFMVKKNVAIILLVIALVLVGVSAYTYFNENEKVSLVSPAGENVVDNGNGKIGVEILPPVVEDRGNGS